MAARAPHVAPLSRERVVDAALALVRTRGLDALSIRAVAGQLHVSPMAVYNHVPDREGLELAMLEAVAASLPSEVSGAGPGERIAARFTAVHDLFAHELWAVHLLVRGDLVPTNSLRFADAGIADLMTTGRDAQTALLDYGFLWHLTLGELLDRHPQTPPTAGSQRRAALQAMSPDELPNYVAVNDVLDPVGAPPPCHFPRSLRLALRALRLDDAG